MGHSEHQCGRSDHDDTHAAAPDEAKEARGDSECVVQFRATASTPHDGIRCFKGKALPFLKGFLKLRDVVL